MLSRLAFRTALQVHKGLAPSIVGAVRASSSDPITPYDGPERDLVNFPRPKRAEFCAPVRYMFIPEEWFEIFYKKTGVTGPYLFGGGLITYLLSKEIWVMEHDFGFVITFFVVLWYGNKKFGKQLSELSNKLIDEDEKKMTSAEKDNIAALKNAIEGEKEAQWRADGQMMVFDAKRENIALQLEAIYRERALQVYQEVKKRLDFQLEIENVDRRIAQKHMVQWIIDNVLKSITAQQEKDTLKQCILDLKGLSART